MNIRTSIILSLLVLGSFGCQKKQAGSPQVAGATDSAALPPPGPLTVSIRLIHTDSTVADSAHPFGPRDTVHAVVHTLNATDTSTLAGKWVYLPKNGVIAENKATLSAGTNDTHFDLINAHPWPAGQYELIVDVDSKARDSVKFPLGLVVKAKK